MKNELDDAVETPSTPDMASDSIGATEDTLSGPIAGIDPCELLSPSELEAAFGEPLGSMERKSIFAYESCNSESESGSRFIILQVGQQSAEQFERDNEETTAMFEVDPIPVTGLGDEAVFYSGLLRVRVDETVIQFATWHTEAEREQALSLTQDLARLALARLP